MHVKPLSFFLLIIVAGCASQPHPEVAAPDTKVTPVVQPEISKAEAHKPGIIYCRKGNEERTLAKIHSHSRGCEVIYTESNQSKAVASAKRDEGHCEKVIAKMKHHLIASGFTCE